MNAEAKEELKNSKTVFNEIDDVDRKKKVWANYEHLLELENNASKQSKQNIQIVKNIT